MADTTSLRDAVGELVRDGQTVALEGFTHLIPSAAGHEIVRQGRHDLHLVRLTPDLVYDQLIGMGCARALTFSWGGNPGVGSLHRFRDAVEHAWPRPIELIEHSHAGLVAAYVAGASGLPFGVLRGYAGTDLSDHTDVATIRCPFTDEQLTAVPAIKPDVTIVHAQQADRRGNVMLWGITGVQREAVLAARASIVTVEEVVDDLDPRGPNVVVLPSWVVTAVAVVPGGTHPSYALGYSQRDNDFYRRWDVVSRDRETFRAWMAEHVLATADWSEYVVLRDRHATRPADVDAPGPDASLTVNV